MDLGTVERGYQVSRYIRMFKQYGILGIIGIVGLGILAYGVWLAMVPEPATVEIIKSEEVASGRQTILVDVAGAVEKPGLYDLPDNSRIGDALVAAGGLSATADREWVAKTINLAEEVNDGGKIYIPAKQLIGGSDNQQVSGSAGQNVGKVNINTASQAELETLAGIGEARAKTIIEKRPYGSVEELISKAKIPESVYEKFKEQITVY